MILQDVSPVDTVRILEAMIPFYIETDYLCKTQGCGGAKPLPVSPKALLVGGLCAPTFCIKFNPIQ
ncbi:hypothetical protein OESDEN_01443 [Oesophagostomum dentatum]|uniref:Uncharacterized protein n=1 Tax=Oesophagostomum dentatum TaxID=61180 RepID=A0A0B1TR49_OESDE|nr:hypothetical protein OESDEN_01443 [Oesophagostomum dentatum]